jgi:Fe-S cluster biosynthesis and repair protein YggX
MTIVACFNLKQAKPTIELKMSPNASPKRVFFKESQNAFSNNTRKSIQILYFLPT